MSDFGRSWSSHLILDLTRWYRYFGYRYCDAPLYCLYLTKQAGAIAMVGMAVATAVPAIVTLSTAVARFAKAVAMVCFFGGFEAILDVLLTFLRRL